MTSHNCFIIRTNRQPTLMNYVGVLVYHSKQRHCASDAINAARRAENTNGRLTDISRRCYHVS